MDSYIERINRVIDYIDLHLHEEMPLQRLADVAHFSPYPFHRIFKAFMNEPLNQYIQRIRLERAAMQLTANPSKSITEIAFNTRFSGSSSFARAFKDHFKVSTSSWRATGKKQEGKIRKIISKNRQMLRKTGEAKLRLSVCITVPDEHPEHHHIVDICVPVKLL